MGRSSVYDPMAVYDEDGFLKIVVAICVPNDLEVVLMVSDKSGTKWKLPGGACNWNEKPEVAVLRELYEESGVKSEINRFIGMFEDYKKHRRMYVFVVTYETHEPQWDEGIRFGRRRSWAPVDVARKWLLANYVEQAIYLDRYSLH